MSVDPRSDLVAEQYGRWVYPAPIYDLPSWLTSNWQWFDPSHSHLNFWPDRDYRPNMRILVAGCGTNQAAILAYTNPSASVVAIDVSEASLAHHQHLKNAYGLDNLELHLLPIEQAGDLIGDFDLIVSTGVLHHLADPDVGARVLAGLLATDGVLALMLYARYGRIGVEIMQSIFRDLDLQQDDASVDTVRQALAAVPSDHPVRAYIAVAPDLDFDAGLVDTFLHGRDRSYTVQDCLDLVSSAGLNFQEWFLRSPYEPYWLPRGQLFDAIAALPDERRWSILERMNARTGRHFFTACRSDRPQDSYRITLDPKHWRREIPTLRYRCHLDDEGVVGPGRRIPCTPEQIRVVQLIDGNRSVQDIVDEVSGYGTDSNSEEFNAGDFVVALLDSLWKQDVVTFALR